MLTASVENGHFGRYPYSITHGARRWGSIVMHWAKGGIE